MLWVFLCGLFVTLIVHELGHWWFMARFGYRPEALCLGLGPRILTLSILDTRVEFRLLPCGAGVVPAKSFYEEVPWKQKLLVYAGGPLANLVLGIIGICLTPFVIRLEVGLPLLPGGFQTVRPFLNLIPETSAEVLSAMPGAIIALGVEKSRPLFAELSAAPVTPSSAILWLSMSSLVLGLANMFPFPPLDGARIISTLMKRVMGRSIPGIIDLIGYQILLLGFAGGVVAVVTGRSVTGWMIAGVVAVTLGTLVWMRYASNSKTGP